MKRPIVIIICIFLCVLFFGACGTAEPAGLSNIPAESTAGSAVLPDGEFFSDRDLSGAYDPEQCAVIELNGDTAVCTSNAVTISGSTVTICDEGSYLIRGELRDGMVIVDAGEDDKPQLILQNVDIHSTSSAPIYVRQADKVFITVEQNTENSLSCGEGYSAIDENNIDGVIFSKADLCLNGTGSLTLASPAGHGIVTKDELTLAGGIGLDISCAGQGLSANDNICIENAKLSINAGKDGMKAENDENSTLGYIYILNGSYDITCAGDGISAGAALSIAGGSYHILAGGGSENGEKKTSDNWGHMGGGPGGPGGPGGRGGFNDSQENSSDTEDSTSIKGIKSAGTLTVSGGSFIIDSADDAVHSNGDLILKGGEFTIETGEDGFHADNSLTVADGRILIHESYEGLEGLSIQIFGGEILLTATDDGLNAAGGADQSGYGGMRGGDRFAGGSADSNIRICGGIVDIHASGDGIDSNGTLEISGGSTIVCCPTTGDTAVLDYEISGSITGGTFIGTGAYQMAQSISSSEQGVIAVSVGNQAAQTEISLTDAEGNTVLTHVPNQDFAIVVLSSPEIIKSETYTITVGAASGSFTAG